MPVAEMHDVIAEGGSVLGMQIEEDDANYDQWITDLEALRRPFPAERIEKLPKPMWKSAWDGESKSHCNICGGYHVAANTIHLDYVGHANTTERLLEVDPCWSWEPMAYTEDGLPKFSNDGLWIKLTILGVTRLGFGDGKSVKEVIGDAIRNAAMRFGVALDLWSKVDLHEGINPDTSTRRSQPQSDAVSRQRGRQGEPAQGDMAPDPAPNQDALDELGSICDQHGYDRRSCGGMYAEWASQQENPGTPRLVDAEPDSIRLFGAYLIVMASPDVDGEDRAGSDAATAGDGDAESRGGDQVGEGEQAAQGNGGAGGDGSGESVPEAHADPAEPVPAGDPGPADAAAGDGGTVADADDAGSGAGAAGDAGDGDFNPETAF